ncbi:unnamed protein product [Miscanthus lutarioriparius]|uniref:Uncharacterized protein n=1 Tax=Miscanthus lutarioriparius TaxID=422564 RepID=A0A811MKI3_9POAL|nr:unnamed protein product [Miscanthus lutarioriparius]
MERQLERQVNGTPTIKPDGGVELHAGMMHAPSKSQNILNELLSWLLGSL